MSTSKHIDVICLVGACLTLLLTMAFVCGETLGLQAASVEMGYESRLFDTSQVHTIDILMEDWDGFLETCQDKEYASALWSLTARPAAARRSGRRGTTPSPLFPPTAIIGTASKWNLTTTTAPRPIMAWIS